MTGQPSNIDRFAQGLAASAGARPAGRVPIDCGNLDIRIGRDGTWYYRGSAIRRKPMVRLFATVLIRDADGQFWLETPAERGRIEVDDAPFTAVELTIEGEGRDQVLTFRTNIDELVTADADHPLRLEPNSAFGGPAPYIRLRDRIDALITRSVYYEMVALGMEEIEGNDHVYGVWSAGRFFELGRWDAAAQVNDAPGPGE